MRLDHALVARGLAPSRARAQAMIKAGAVFIDGASARKAATPVEDSAVITAQDPCPWVSRAALKLVHALDLFAIDMTGAQVLDVGASTGGFTEVCLARGAAHVTAIDVGRDQLRPHLRADPRVTAIDGLNAKDLTAAHLPAPPTRIVSDVSFISLTKALPEALALAAPGAVLIALIKPQFEVGRADVGKGGVVKTPAARARAVETARVWLTAQGWRELGLTNSPIVGGDGNHEYLIAAERTA